MRRERPGRVDVRVAVKRAVAQELRALEPRDHAEHPLLLGGPEARLEADEVPHLPGAVFLAQLDHRVGLTPGASPGIHQPHRLHGTDRKSTRLNSSHTVISY